MKQENNQPGLDEVINSYLLARAEMSEAGEEETRTLARFAARYPQHARALFEFSANLAVMEELSLPESNENLPLSSRGEETIKRLLQQRFSDSEPQLTGIIVEAKKRDMSAVDLARVARLSVPVVVKLDRRLIRFASIPRLAIERVAGALNRSFESVNEYLQGAAVLAPAANYRSDSAPQIPEQQDFFDAIEADLNLAEEARDEWRKLKEKR